MSDSERFSQMARIDGEVIYTIFYDPHHSRVEITGRIELRTREVADLKIILEDVIFRELAEEIANAIKGNDSKEASE